jgi:hypothetical protein
MFSRQLPSFHKWAVTSYYKVRLNTKRSFHKWAVTSYYKVRLNTKKELSQMSRDQFYYMVNLNTKHLQNTYVPPQKHKCEKKGQVPIQKCRPIKMVRSENKAKSAFQVFRALWILITSTFSQFQLGYVFSSDFTFNYLFISVGKT